MIRYKQHFFNSDQQDIQEAFESHDLHMYVTCLFFTGDRSRDHVLDWLTMQARKKVTYLGLMHMLPIL